MPIITKTVTVEVAAKRADLVVRDLTQLPRSDIRGLFDHGCITVNGAKLSAGDPLAVGTVLVARYDPSQRYREKNTFETRRDFDVVFEDRHLIVVDKAAGILTVPTDLGEARTLVDQVQYHVNRGPKTVVRMTVVQRLDRDTSGLLVFGKNKIVGAKLQEQLKARKPEREYAVIVAGSLKTDRGTFRSFIRTTADLREESTSNPNEGKEAITHFEVVARLQGATQVKAYLETGRRNQIRVHFSESGHPVLGDAHYEPAKANHRLWTAKRLALHAAALGFVHPMTGAKLRFRSELPECFGVFLHGARA